MTDVTRLKETLGHPDLAWIIQRIRRRLERGSEPRGTVTLHHATVRQRDAVDRLFGRRASRGETLTVQLGTVEEVLRHAGLASSLREAVEALTGAIVDLKSEHAGRQEQWARLFENAKQRLSPRQELHQWLEGLRNAGTLRRLARGNPDTAGGLLDGALKVVMQLPIRGIPLALLAAETTGDSHSLDAGQPLGSIVLRAAALVSGVDDTRSAEGRRDAWAGAGVLCDELSAPVLVLNLRGDTVTLTGRALRLHAEQGEPYRLSTRQLLRDPPVFDVATVGRIVYVCENPSIVAAAAYRLGSRGAPLVCIEGQPKTAARLLLGRLTAAGVGLRYHGDFDWDGVSIANLVMKRHGAVPWRLSAACYRAASGGKPLGGKPLPVSWDVELMKAMTERKVAIHEELVVRELLEDLRE